MATAVTQCNFKASVYICILEYRFEKSRSHTLQLNRGMQIQEPRPIPPVQSVAHTALQLWQAMPELLASATQRLGHQPKS